MPQAPEGGINSQDRAITLAVVTTFISLFPTAYVALTSNSSVLFADLIRCGVEFLAIFLSWIVVRKISRGDESFYDFGLGKWEQLATLAVAAAMMLSFLVITFIAFSRLYFPVEVHNTGLGLLLALLSVAGNAYLWRYNARIGSFGGSPIAESQSRLFRAKTLVSAVVASSLACSEWGAGAWLLYADPIGSCIVAGFLLRSALTLFASSTQDLLDRSIDEARRMIVLKGLIKHEASYDGLLAIRTRRSGMRIYVEVDLQFDGDRTMSDVSRICDVISSDIASALPKSRVHITPRAPKA